MQLEFTVKTYNVTNTVTPTAQDANAVKKVVNLTLAGDKGSINLSNLDPADYPVEKYDAGKKVTITL